ncbi:pyridoxamine 5'-phosphate oxidase family protein [Naasia lichenicola]|uniref:General stress protein n=1 Tax=Naasia lichenicola TaxID=2565933 RepID=A0A4S4FGR2_9MICO|nr:pyridoxamine 5'-phosphate oxidase family protein [Naasia lichenicola]THG29423.1 general stress protein [Naasia lichenicola]
MATAEEIEQLGKLIGKADIGLLTTTSADGQLVSRPMGLIDRDFDGTLWFFTQDPSHKTDEVRASDQVNVALQAGDGWVSVAGSASVVKDRSTIDELWTSGAEAWFENGKDDPTVALLKVDADTAELWTIKDPKVVTLFKYAKAIVTGDTPDVGETKTIAL